MKLITRDTDYALRALCFITKHKKQIVSVAQLVKELKIPRPFLRKLLQVLNKKSIPKPANKIFLLDLMKIFQGPWALNECFFKKDVCPNMHVCALRKKINNIEGSVIKELKSITIESLL
jgi:Rrf2 family protein